ncbi:hypothetical protein WME76_34380 [Sorangium sp. So ce119]|uniref:hypothetical protein n=1 Tax=Sorangium sp. So ce119 TaxID=3133279 RepID=UPI003F60804E
MTVDRKKRPKASVSDAAESLWPMAGLDVAGKRAGAPAENPLGSAHGAGKA